MNSTDPTNSEPELSPMQALAQNPAATAKYLAEVQGVLLSIGANLEDLARETRIHLRGTYVEGDRWYHARLRSQPVEKVLKRALKDLEGLTQGLETAAFKRHEFDEKVKNLPGERHQKALDKGRNKNHQIPSPQTSAPQGEQQPTGHGYSGPASIYDLKRNRESA
ncbi:hypothetical protein AB0E08_47110 [Streptomyces sp. NPDC048281]|uniref:hypothetical protein n=1 Tax=Streptomyces sp. NPDC048281 TaxID=3154715 RepID=UPI00343E8795